MSKGMVVAKKKSEGLWIPGSILNISELNAGEKMLLAHFYSFGEKGCWQSNKTLAGIFKTTERTISRTISRLKEHIKIKGSKSYFRTIWVKDGQNCPTYLDKSGEVSRTKTSNSLGQNCPATYTYTNTDTNNNHAQEENIISFSIERVKDAAVAVGLTAEQAERFYHHYKSQGWQLGNGQPITDLVSALVRWRNNEYKFAPVSTRSIRGGPASTLSHRGGRQERDKSLTAEEVDMLTGNKK